MSQRESLIAEINENKSINRFHSILLILAMAAILSFVGYLMFGMFGFVSAIVLTLFSMFFGQRVSVAWIMRMYKAQRLHPQQAPELFSMFEQLVDEAKLNSRPALYYIPTRMPNAFATGFKKNTAVAITDGLLRMMNAREIRGILAHEVAHLMHGDTKVMALADTMSRLVATVCRIGIFVVLFSGIATLFGGNGLIYFIIGGAVMFFAPTIMILLQLALSRTREFNADLGAVQLTGDSLGLASALRKLERMISGPKGILGRIIRPGQRRAQPAFLRTHPPTDERIERLLEHADASPPPIVEIRAPVPQLPRKLTFTRNRIRRHPRYRVQNGSWF